MGRSRKAAKAGKRKRSSDPKAIGVYIFAGAFTEGVKRHFDVTHHLEEGPFGVETAMHNNPGLQVHQVPADWPLEDLSADFVFCNPPCAPWSAAAHGRGVHWSEDPRLSCWANSFNVLKALRPKVWACESVRGVFTKGREMLDGYAKRARKMGYKATYLYVDAQNHGIPQRRRRFFMVFHKVRLPWEPTNETALVVDDVLPIDGPLGWFKPLNDKMKKLASMTEPGKGVRKAFDVLNARKIAKHKASLKRKDGESEMQGKGKPEWIKGRPNFLTSLLNPETVCGVVIGNNKVHPNGERMISINEAKALCGFDPNFEFQGNPNSYFAQLTKAVMPPVGEYLARIVRRGIDKDRPVRSVEPEFVNIGRTTVEKDFDEMPKDEKQVA